MIVKLRTLGLMLHLQNFVCVSLHKKISSFLLLFIDLKIEFYIQSEVRSNLIDLQIKFMGEKN